MATREISKISFTAVYPLYLKKVEKKARSKQDLDTVICWLTGYSQERLNHHISIDINFQDFFDQAPRLHPNRGQITGVVCGVRVEDIQDPITQNVRYLDKLVDELAKGKLLDKILR